jgi:hypothetical protein
MSHYHRAAESAQSIVYTSRWGEVLVVDRASRASIYVQPGAEASEILDALADATSGVDVEMTLAEFIGECADNDHETLPQEVLEDLRCA